jgi:hypothetical protein
MEVDVPQFIGLGNVHLEKCRPAIDAIPKQLPVAEFLEVFVDAVDLLAERSPVVFGRQHDVQVVAVFFGDAFFQVVSDQESFGFATSGAEAVVTVARPGSKVAGVGVFHDAGEAAAVDKPFDSSLRISCCFHATQNLLSPVRP